MELLRKMNGFHLFDHKFIMMWGMAVVVLLAFTSCEDSNMIVLMGHSDPQGGGVSQEDCGEAVPCKTEADCGNDFSCFGIGGETGVCREKCKVPGAYRCKCGGREQCVGDENNAFWVDVGGCGNLTCSEKDGAACIKPVCHEEDTICASYDRMYVCKDGEFVDAECKGICIVTKQGKAKCVDGGDVCKDEGAQRCDDDDVIEKCSGRNEYHWSPQPPCELGKRCEYLYSESGSRVGCALEKCEFNTYQCDKSHHEVQFCKGNAWFNVANCRDAQLKCIDGKGSERAHCGR